MTAAPEIHLLLVEDHPALARNVVEFLEPAGFAVTVADRGGEALRLARKEPFDLVVLDLMLPDLDGLEVCRELRRNQGASPAILMLTARDTLEDKLEGFGHGADDYLTKPFALTELEARLRALLRRREPSCRLLVLGPLELDPGTRAVTRDGRPLALTPTCFQILRQLMLAHPRVVGRAEMEQALWGGFPPGSDSLRTHVAALRRELDKPFGEPLLENQYGVGYRLNLPPRPAAE